MKRQRKTTAKQSSMVDLPTMLLQYIGRLSIKQIPLLRTISSKKTKGTREEKQPSLDHNTNAKCDNSWVYEVRFDTLLASND